LILAAAEVRRQRALKTGLTMVEDDSDVQLIDESIAVPAVSANNSSIEKASSLPSSPAPSSPPSPSAPPSSPLNLQASSSAPQFFSPRKDALDRFRHGTDMPRSDDLDHSDGSAIQPSQPHSPSFPPQPEGGPTSPYSHAFQHWVPHPPSSRPDCELSPT
jgi:hypothetical protein